MLNRQPALHREKTRHGSTMTVETWRVIQVSAAERVNRQFAFIQISREELIKLHQEKSEIFRTKLSRLPIKRSVIKVI